MMNQAHSARSRSVARHIMAYPYKLWGYGEGIALEALLLAAEQCGEPAYLAFVAGQMERWLRSRQHLSYADHVAPGRALVMLYQRTGEPALVAQARKLAALLEGLPREPQGARLHRPDHPVYHSYVYVDCMDFDAPFLSLLATGTGEARYFDLAADCLLGHARVLWDPAHSLFYHLYDAERGQVNGAFWGRGNGWAALGMVGTLELLPRSHRAYPQIVALFQNQMAALIKLQAPSGDWHTVLDHPATYLEGSLAPMFYCALERGIRAGVLPDRYRQAARRAWDALTTRLDHSGLVCGVSEASPPGSADHYQSIPAGGSFPWGQGPALEALVLAGAHNRLP